MTRCVVLGWREAFGIEMSLVNSVEEGYLWQKGCHFQKLVLLIWLWLGSAKSVDVGGTWLEV